jgi:hypothetical protein
MLPLAIGVALMVPVMVAGVRRYTTAAQRSMAFSLFYTLMNVGYAIAGFLFDQVRGLLGERGQVELPLLAANLSTYRVLFLLSFLATIPGLLVTWFFLRDGVEATEEGITITPETPKYQDRSVVSAFLLMARDAFVSTGRIFAAVWRQPSFYRFLLFLGLVVGVRLVFYHWHYTFPKYGIRELGEGAKIGNLYSVLNPVIIVVLVPTLGALTQRISAYMMIVVGTFVSAAAVFILALPAEWFAGLASGPVGHLIGRVWLGVEGDVNPLYVAITACVGLFSVGEAIWSPRLYEYTASIAPKGQEGSYMALSLLPYFVAKFFVGMLSGRLLAAYCPADGPRDSQTMWLLIALMAAATPIGIFALRRFIRVKEAGRDEPEPAAH